MRLFEVLLLIASMSLLWQVIWLRKRPGVISLRGAPLLLLIICLCHLIIEGGRWQMAPVYVSVLLVLWKYVVWSLQRTPSERTGMRTPILLSIVALPVTLIAAVLPVLLPVFSFEKPTGPYQVGTVSYTWTDTSRTAVDGKPRRVKTQVWYPAATDNSSIEERYISDLPEFSAVLHKRYGLPLQWLRYIDLIKTNAYSNASFAPDLEKAPLLFFSHGNMLGARFTNSFQTIELASHGYVVVAVEHPGTALLTTYADGTYEVFTDTSSHLPMEYQVQNEATIPIINEQTKDIVFVLEQMKRMGEENANSPLIGKIDFARLGVIGHSQGGAAAVDVLYKNRAFQAAINMDGYMYGEAHSEALDRPVMVLQGGFEVEELASPPEMEQIEQQRREHVLANKGSILHLEQAGHLSFTDIPLYSPLIEMLSPNIVEQHKIINEATLCFMNRHLKKDQSASCKYLPQKYAGVRLQTVGMQ
ncbi:alpha/beta hydrolase family protein [Brevibacillus sp. SIMBA_040]|uniref:alpha/beta hydrolase family protein n=1 Tax=unclassified Brevibacillus TaxID=2684853 RepID=UPI00397A8BBE